MIGVILAAGDGNRLKSSKADCCKPLIKINGKRLIEYAFDNLISLQINEVYVVVGKEGQLIEDVLGDKYNNLKISYVIQPEQKGLINAFVHALNVVGCDEPIILQLSDEIFIDLKIEYIKKLVESRLYDFYCGITYEDDPEKIKSNFSVDVDDKGVIRKCIEKPVSVINNIKGTGFCVFDCEALRLLSNIVDLSDIYDLCDYINFLVCKNKSGLALHIAEKEFNINTFAEVYEVQSILEI